MERVEWLGLMRTMAEVLYDRLAPLYRESFGFYENATHLAYLQKFLARVPAGAPVLSAGCGAGRYDGLLLEAGHPVTGIDQSAGMLARARERWPGARYEKMGLQEMAYRTAFGGVTCIDALEHVSPEDYGGILRRFGEALAPGGVLYFTIEGEEPDELEAAYERAKARGLPVVYGEVVDGVDMAYAQVAGTAAPVAGEVADAAVYHFYPSLEQARAWIAQAGLVIEEEGLGSGYHHFLCSRAGCGTIVAQP